MYVLSLLPPLFLTFISYVDECHVPISAFVSPSKSNETLAADVGSGARRTVFIVLELVPRFIRPRSGLIDEPNLSSKAGCAARTRPSGGSGTTNGFGIPASR